MSQTLNTPSNASTLRRPLHLNSHHKHHNKTAARWKRLVQRRQTRRESKQQELDILQHIIAENQRVDNSPDRMTDPSAPDGDSVTSTDDSLFEITNLDRGFASDSSISCNTTISNDSTYSIYTCSSTDSTWFDNFGPPPPGSLLDSWDKPFPPGSFHNFPELFKDGMVTIDTSSTQETTADELLLGWLTLRTEVN